MLLDDTKHKLNEASFFLVRAKSSLTNPEELSFYLSAFVTAGRSVTFTMQKEFGNNSRYGIWYKERILMINDIIFTIFKHLRNITVKEGKLEFKRKVNLSPINEKISSTTSVGFKVIRNGKVIKESNPNKQDAIPDSEKKTIEPNKVKVFLNIFPIPEGIELCDQYLKKLRILVSDAESMIRNEKS